MIWDGATIFDILTFTTFPGVNSFLSFFISFTFDFIEIFWGTTIFSKLPIIDELIESLGFQQEVMVDLIGSPSRNEWNGRVKEQIVLEDYFITKDFIIEESDQYLDSSGALVF